MTIYVDNNNRVYTTPGEGRTQVTTNVFDGVPYRVIECYKYSNVNGIEFVQASTSAEDIAHRYELEALETQNAELVDAMAAMVEEVYESDTEIIGG